MPPFFYAYSNSFISLQTSTYSVFEQCGKAKEALNFGVELMSEMAEFVEIEKIKNVKALYSYYFDARKLEKLVDLFADDAVCEFTEEFGGHWIGKVNIRQNFKFQLDKLDRDWATIHAITNHVVALNADGTASGRCYLLDYMVQREENPLFAVAVYDDLFCKVGSRWLIQRTRIEFHWMDKTYL